MLFSNDGRNALLSGGLGNAISHASLHTGNPSTTGANEATGGSPAYARKAITWAAAASGQRASLGAIAFDVPAGTYEWVGFWSALTSGTFYGATPVGASSTIRGFGAVDAGGVTANEIDSKAHGLANGERVAVFNVFAESLPTGLSEGTLYYVVGVTTDTFQVSTSSGGSAVDITAGGELFFVKCVPETFTGQGTLTLSSGGLILDGTTL